MADRTPVRGRRQEPTDDGRMDLAEALPLAALATASVVVFLLMRHPSLRRSQFQNGQSFSFGTSLACALGLFVGGASLFWWLGR